MVSDRSYPFVHVDVFTDRRFEGNPLAVFPDARGLDDADMQRIARELNLSETSFVFPPSQPDAVASLRMFTPGYEVPFAGHPTIGTAFVLQSAGRLPPGPCDFAFEEPIGRVPVRLEAGPTFMAWLTTPPVTLLPPYENRTALANALGLKEADIRSDVPAQVATAGNPFFYVALTDEAAVDRTNIDIKALKDVFRSTGDTQGVVGVYVFAVRSNGAYSRMFGPEAGIIEDPATGSATGPLAAYVLEHALIPERDGLRLIAEQGTAMGRRSLLHILITGTGTNRRIEVGGTAVHAIDAVLHC
jgi:trans-2,3-dihydro-3-hydroxyanthranilate isomerase